MSNRAAFRNRYTGLPPTPDEWRQMQLRARRIMSSPYSAPELIDWAMNVLPNAELYFWEPSNKAVAERTR